MLLYEGFFWLHASLESLATELRVSHVLVATAAVRGPSESFLILFGDFDFRDLLSKLVPVVL